MASRKPRLTEGKMRACAGQANSKTPWRKIPTRDRIKIGLCFLVGFAGLALGLVNGYIMLHGHVAVQCTLPEVPSMDRDLACWILEVLY